MESICRDKWLRSRQAVILTTYTPGGILDSSRYCILPSLTVTDVGHTAVVADIGFVCVTVETLQWGKERRTLRY
jgi:hypothetical protein